MTNEIKTVFNNETIISGVKYKVVARILFGKKIVKALVERKQDNGSVVWAHLSHRQASAERRAVSVFATEINKAFAEAGL